MRRTLKACFSLCVLTLILTGVGQAAVISLPVKRGQKAINPKLLPLSCLAVTTHGATFSLRQLTVENTKTKTRYIAVFEKSLDLLTAAQADQKAHSLAIMQLPEGHYRILKLMFILPEHPELDLIFDFGESRNFNFKVNPGAVNYHGSMTISADWKMITSASDAVTDVLIGPWNPSIPGWGAESKLNSRVELEDTLSRDVKWVADVVPGMTKLPMVSSPLASQ